MKSKRVGPIPRGASRNTDRTSEDVLTPAPPRDLKLILVPPAADLAWLAKHLEAAIECSEKGKGLVMSWHEVMAPIQRKLLAWVQEEHRMQREREKEGMWLAR